MHIGRLLVIVIAASLVSCEREGGGGGGGGGGGPSPVPASGPAPARTSRPALPTSDEIFGSYRSTTRPATTQAGLGFGFDSPSAARQPAETPEATVTRMFELMQKQDVAGVRAMMADPLPADRLRAEVSAVAERMNSGAKWNIVDSRTEGIASVVIFRTTFADGKNEITPLVLVNRYDRWRVLLGSLNLRKLTTGEKQSMNKVMKWAADRLDQLRGVSTTNPATTRTTRTTTPATATTPGVTP